MTKTIQIKTVNELKQLIDKFKALERTMPTLQLRALEKAADEAIISDIHREMETQNFSKKIIETTFIGPIEVVQGQSATIHIISDYVPDNGFDVGEAREEGTKDHFIPVTKKPLSWIDPKTGRRLYDAKGHFVSGLPRLLIIERTIDRNQQKVKTAYENNIVSSYNQVLGV